MGSETTAAAAGNVGEVRRDPFAMLPVLRLPHGRLLRPLARDAARDAAEPPRIFYVNWFRKDDDGKFLWPGFGENMRVLGWVFRRCEGTADAVETPIGRMPTPEALDARDLDASREDLERLMEVDVDEWKRELPLIEEFFAKFGDRLPGELRAQLDALQARLECAV